MYGSARKSYLQMLDTVHHQGLRLALGAFRTSPVTSLYVEADEPSLYLRREKLSLQYAIRLAANQRNPAFKVTFSPQFLELYEHKPNAIKPFGLRILPLLESSNINPNNIEKHFITDIPPWCIRKPNILFDLHTSKKTVSNSNILNKIFKSSSHITQSINIFILMVPKMERRLGVLFYLETTVVLYVFLMALLCLLQKQKQLI